MSAQMVSLAGSGAATSSDTGPMSAENDMLGLEQRARELAQETGGGAVPIREPVKFVRATASESQEQPKVSYLTLYCLSPLTLSLINLTLLLYISLNVLSFNTKLFNVLYALYSGLLQ